MNFKVDIKRIREGKFHVQGWALANIPEHEVKINVYDTKGNIVDFSLVRVKRDDVAEIFLKDYAGNRYFGFDIEFPYDDDSDELYYIEFSCDNEKGIDKISKTIVAKFNTTERKKKELLLAYLNNQTFKRAFTFLTKEGPIAFIKKTKRKLKGIDVDYDYSEWYELTKTTDTELARQRNDNNFNYKPFFSIVIPVYDTSDEFLTLLFESIFSQTYQNFEICIADATDYNNCKNNPKKFFDNLIKINKPNINHYNFNLNNLHISYINENKSIADNTNAAISMAKGDYIVLCDHDDALTYDALYENVKVLNEFKDALIIYSDEDKVDTKNTAFFEPAFKPDFNLDMLLSVNYFCHLTVIKKELLDILYKRDLKYERSEYDGAQDYDLFLRLVSAIATFKGNANMDKYIRHIPKVLYHWRCHKKSTSTNVESKSYAFTNGEKAIMDFYNNSTFNFTDVASVEKGFDFGLYHTVYNQVKNEPLISIIIPNKDHIDDLDIVIKSIKKSNYRNYEIIICENNSTDNKTFEYYNSLKSEKNILVVTYKGDFNYSKINNFATSFAKGDYYLFLNNDIEMISSNSIYEMYHFCKRNDVGAVGAKLLYKDKTYQHAGVVIGIGGIADHSFRGISDFDHTYMNRARICQDVSAVTAACLMIKKEVFLKIGGFDEKLAVAFNDIDLCLKVRNNGYLIVYNPFSEFFHYESKSRGLEDTPDKVKRFNGEFAYFVKKWNRILDKIDEYYNPNLTLRKNNFALRDLKYENIGQPFPIPDEIKNLMKNINI